MKKQPPEDFAALVQAVRELATQMARMRPIWTSLLTNVPLGDTITKRRRVKTSLRMIAT